MRGALLISAIVAFIFTVSDKAHGTMWAETTAAKLTAAAYVVLIGTVRSHKSAWNSAQNFIWTDVTVAVDRVLKAADGKFPTKGEADGKFPTKGEVYGKFPTKGEIVVRVPGGSVDGVFQRSADQITFEQGEKAIWFLRRDDKLPRVYRLVNGGRGKVRIVDGQTFADPSLKDLNRIKESVAIEMINKALRR